MIINNNISSIFGNRQLAIDSAMTDKNMERLSSGMRINRAGDDASGLAVSEKMRSQIKGLNQALRNTQDGVSFIQTTEGYLQEVGNALQRVRELSVQAANGIYSDEDRGYIQTEVAQMVDEIDRIGSQAQFNGLKMLSGMFSEPTAESTPAAEMYLHLGANMDERVQVQINTMNATALGIRNVGNNNPISISTQDSANIAIGTIDQALSKVNKQRADLGAYQNRLESATRSIMVGSENLQAAESRIRDTNMAQESSLLAKNQVLTQAAISMLAQANQRPQMVLQLLR
ncbi:MAG: flagellin [Spirochaetota bacterium]|nr:flagellin [Spirochaetota bacterium]